MAAPAAPTPPPPPPSRRASLHLAPARSQASVDLDRQPIRERGGVVLPTPPFVPWAAFLRELDRRWQVGPPTWPNPNMAIVGMAGSGKSRLTREITELRDRVVLFGTKLVDEPLYAPLIKDGWKLRDRWDPTDTSQDRVIFRPPLYSPSREDLDRQREAFRRALMSLYRVGGWTLWLDEVRYLTELLKLDRELNLLWLQGRSAGTVMLALTQRPVSVPLNMFEQSRFLITFKIKGLEDRRTMASYAGENQPVVIDVAARLPKYELLMVDAEDDYAVRTRVGS